jgi:hypothetical protein
MDAGCKATIEGWARFHYPVSQAMKGVEFFASLSAMLDTGELALVVGKIVQKDLHPLELPVQSQNLIQEELEALMADLTKKCGDLCGIPSVQRGIIHMVCCALATVRME